MRDKFIGSLAAVCQGGLSHLVTLIDTTMFGTFKLLKWSTDRMSHHKAAETRWKWMRKLSLLIIQFSASHGKIDNFILDEWYSQTTQRVDGIKMYRPLKILPSVSRRNSSNKYVTRAGCSWSGWRWGGTLSDCCPWMGIVTIFVNINISVRGGARWAVWHVAQKLGRDPPLIEM